MERRRYKYFVQVLFISKYACYQTVCTITSCDTSSTRGNDEISYSYLNSKLDLGKTRFMIAYSWN